MGAAIVFENGDTSRALAEFPPSAEILQESFVAVFTGPQKPTPEEERHMQGNTAEDRAAQRRMAVNALRKEVELWVEKELLDQQAQHLMQTNYVYQETGHYRKDLVEEMPAGEHVPAALEATATFVKVDHDVDDTMQATGPADSTTAAEQIQEVDDTMAGRWMSVLDESLEDAMEMSKIPSLQAGVVVCCACVWAAPSTVCLRGVPVHIPGVCACVCTCGVFDTRVYSLHLGASLQVHYSHARPSHAIGLHRRTCTHRKVHACAHLRVNGFHRLSARVSSSSCPGHVGAPGKPSGPRHSKRSPRQNGGG